MVAQRFDTFGGMKPIISKRLLQPGMAEYSANTELLSGELRGLRQPSQIAVLTGGTYKKAYRIPVGDAGSYVWLPMTSPSAKLVKGPLTNDLWKRYIWLDGNDLGTPAYLRQSDLDYIVAGTPAALRLGVPGPLGTPGLTASGGSGATTTRSYVYTYVNIFGEESPPSAPVSGSNYVNATWTPQTFVAQPDSTRGGSKINLYRTVTGPSSTDFYRVAQFVESTTSYNDTRTDAAVVADGITLPSTSWLPPPQVEGFVEMPGGFLAAWNGFDLYFSEPYRPWSWPPSYALSVQSRIIGCEVTNQSLVVITRGQPVFLTGNTPGTLTKAVAPLVEPGVSSRAITASIEGVYYASKNGMMLVSSSNGISSITRQIIEEKDWHANYAVNIAGMAKFETTLIVFQSAGNGYVLDSRAASNGLNRLVGFAEIDNIWLDPFTGEAHMIANNTVYVWGQPDAAEVIFGWTSAEFQLAKPVNFGAVIVSRDVESSALSGASALPPPPPYAGDPPYDLTSLIGYCLIDGSVLGSFPLPGDAMPGFAGTRGWPDWPGVLGASLGYSPGSVPSLPDDSDCQLSVFAGGVLIFSANVDTDTPYRLPSGFKSDIWQFAVVSRVPVYNVQLAETAKELGTV